MSNDLTQKLPGDNEPNAPQNDDRISVLISAVQSLSSDIQEVKVRIEALEKTVTERSFETKPIWERALAEIAGTRAELGETRAELKSEIAEVRAELGETRAELKSEIAEVRAELGETRAELKSEIAEVRAELAETRAELRGEMKDGFRKLGSKMEVLNEDLLTLRADQRLVDKRVESLESKTP